MSGEVEIGPKGQALVFHANTSWYLKRFYSELLSELTSDGWTIAAVVPENDHRLCDLGVAVKVLPLDRGGMNPVADLMYLARLTKLLRELKPRTVFNFTVKPNIYGAIAASWSGSKSINTVSGLGSSLLSEGIGSKMVRALYRIASTKAANVFLNRSDMSYFMSAGIVARQQILVPGAGVNTRQFSRSKPISNENTFLYLGRLIKDKGVGEFIETAKQLKGRGAQFLLAGEADPSNPSSISERELDSLEEEKVITRLGFVEDVRELFEDIDCLVLPSYSEGLSRVMMEAASMQVGLIASDVPGCRELIPDNGGILVQPRSVPSLSEAVERYMSKSPSQKEVMKNTARNHVLKNYEVGLVVNQYKGLIA